MILEKAYYQQNYQTGNFLFVTYGLGAFIESGETHQEVYAQLKERVYAQFRADNPHLQEVNGVDVLPNQEDNPFGTTLITTGGTLPEQPTKAQTVEEQIRTCQDADTLEKTYKYLVRTNPSWQKAYEDTMEKLKAYQKQTITK